MASKTGFKLTFWPAMSDTIFFWDISKKSQKQNQFQRELQGK